MSKTLHEDNYILYRPVTFKSKASGKVLTIDPKHIALITINTNKYLASLAQFFKDVDFDFYSSLGQRNLSGFIGEIFVKSFEKSVNGFRFNPHGDGRPDILDVSTEESKLYFEKECFTKTEEGLNPIRSKLAPYKFGGIEVKASIGSPVANYKQRLPDELGIANFIVGTPRINYLSSITYWGHHASCENLLGLFYDYYPDANNVPQVIAVMHSELDVDKDWNAVSVGKEGSKKTSNTSLTTLGRTKLYTNVITALDDERYLEKLQQIGLKLNIK